MDPTRIPCRLKPAAPEIRREHLKKHRHETEAHLQRGDLPAVVDFRDTGLLPPILDQGQLGSCVFNATSNGLRYLMRRQRLADFQPSRLWLYWYTRMDIMPAEENAPPPDPHEDSGATVHSVCGALLVYHACPESLWPYDDNVYGRFSHAPDLKAQQWAKRPCDFRFMPLHSNDLQELRRALAAGYPVLVGVQIYQQTFMQSQGGVITLPDRADVAAGGHCLLIIGYDDNRQVFIAMNSWTASWGDRGFAYLPYQFLADPALSYDWEALRVFSMSGQAASSSSPQANSTSISPAISADNRPANANMASGSYFGQDPAKQPSCLSRLFCCT